uniref:Saposin B-type domain-containing protein n=1 Tax=Angiostrongylus cantonensis TaxID=6313 RepID=A0A0K0DKK4_ANGCA
MIFLLLAAFFITINAKSLTVKKSEIFRGSNEKSKSDDFTKRFTAINYEVIPTDYLCDFCNAVIVKLKERQNEEADFEENMKEECWKYNRTDLDDGNVCELINKVALQRLKNDDAEKICIEEKMCPDILKELREKEEKERREKEETARRKMEEEDRKINEEIEMIKSEGARLEYEKRREEEARRKAERARIGQLYNAYGEEEYVIDEVAKEEDEKNDYLDHRNVSRNSTLKTQLFQESPNRQSKAGRNFTIPVSRKKANLPTKKPSRGRVSIRS